MFRPRFGRRFRATPPCNPRETMLILETYTELEPAEVLDRARSFFVLAGSPQAAFVEHTAPDYLRLHTEVGEIVIGVFRTGDGTLVRGSASRGTPLLSRFFTLLGRPMDVRQRTQRRGLNATFGAQVDGPRRLATPTSRPHERAA